MIDSLTAFLSYLVILTMTAVLARNLFGLWRARQGNERRQRNAFRVGALIVALYAIWLYSSHISGGAASIPASLGRPLVLGLAVVLLAGSD